MLTDPELDLLRELLEDDPTSDLYLQVGGELVRRAQWADAFSILAKGVSHDHHPDGHALLARAALEMGDYDVCLASLEAVDTDPRTNGQNASLRMLAVERKGDLEQARALAKAYLEVVPEDVVATAVLERLDAPPPSRKGRASDPFITVDRAERYVVVGRTDRAIRVYRRLLFHNPGDRGIELRLRQLSAGDIDQPMDDRSEELTDPGLAPPEFTMPAPGLGSSTVPSGERVAGPPSAPPKDSGTASTGGGPGRRRRRRSLIQR